MHLAHSSSPLVDVIIAVHTDARPIDRAVRSVLRSGLPISDKGGVRVIVSCHNVPSEVIAEVLSEESRSAATFVEYHDKSRTCAAPRNRGLDASTARYVCFLDSDDTLEDGALAAWVEIAEMNRSAAVMAKIIFEGAGINRSPVTRPGRYLNLDPVADRLAHRAVPFGLLRRETIERLGLRFNTSYFTGEDVVFQWIWFSGERIEFARHSPGYVMHDDATDRVTKDIRPFADDLRPFVDMLKSEWYINQTRTVRRSIAHAVIRNHVFGGIRSRANRYVWSVLDTYACREIVHVLCQNSPDVFDILPMADRDLLDIVVHEGAMLEKIVAASALRFRYGHPKTLIPRNIRYLLDRDAPIRYLTAALLLR